MSSQRRISYVKLSQRDLNELGLSAKKKIQTSPQGTPLEEKKLSFVKISESDLKVLGLLEDFSGNTQKVCKLENKLEREKPKKRRNLFPSPVRKSISSIHKTRNSTISRNSTLFKKQTKIKEVAKLNLCTSNVSRFNKNKNLNISKNFTGSLEQAETSGARKELFKVPSSKPSRAKSNVNAFNGSSFQSPLMDLEKADILLKKIPCIQISVFETPQLPQKTARPELSTVSDQDPVVSPSTAGATIQNFTADNSDSEFELDEKICQQNQIKNDYSYEVRLICDILNKDKEEFQRYNEARDKRMNNIIAILNKISDCSTLEGRSEQISDKLNTIPKTAEYVNTSTPSKQTSVLNKKSQCSSSNTDDLRINLLKSNFDRNCKKTPKEMKAQNMYNDLRKKFNLLVTPKLNKSIKDPKDTNNISVKVQEQCLSLLDTPKH